METFLLGAFANGICISIVVRGKRKLRHIGMNFLVLTQHEVRKVVFSLVESTSLSLDSALLRVLQKLALLGSTLIRVSRQSKESNRNVTKLEKSRQPAFLLIVKGPRARLPDALLCSFHI